MGGGTFNSQSYSTYSQSTQQKSTSQVFSSRNMKDSLNPLGVAIRESRDSVDNPLSTPIIVALDVTGSMGMIADNIARSGLGTLFTGILDRKPVTNPHVMFMGIGDAHSDSAPLQASQFEADNRVVEQLTELWLEGNGGGNGSESYHLPWYFAAFHTQHDCYQKRAKKGYLFTVGDEGVPPPLTKQQVERVCGDKLEANLSAQDLLALAQQYYHVYHVIIAEGHFARQQLSNVQQQWRDVLGEHAITLSDYTKLPETIVSAIEVSQGMDAAKSASAWGNGSNAILGAIKSLPKSVQRPLLGNK